MIKQCPSCGRFSLDYNSELKVWRCLWFDCLYVEKKKGVV